MKKLPFAKLILPGLMVLFTACKKEAGTPESSTQTEKANYVKVENNQVTVKLLALEGFSDPCFNMFFDAVFQESFRFNGGNNLWNYKNLTQGLHSFSIACMHECTNEGSEIIKFEIDDGKNHQEVSAREIDHCKYEFWLNVN